MLCICPSLISLNRAVIARMHTLYKEDSVLTDFMSTIASFDAMTGATDVTIVVLIDSPSVSDQPLKLSSFLNPFSPVDPREMRQLYERVVKEALERISSAALQDLVVFLLVSRYCSKFMFLISRIREHCRSFVLETTQLGV